jgi:hypothetical protein
VAAEPGDPILVEVAQRVFHTLFQYNVRQTAAEGRWKAKRGKTLTMVFCALAILAGCAEAPPAKPQVATTPPEIIAYAALQRWLNQQQEVRAMTTEQVVAELVSLHIPEGADQLFYFGLLNQQLQTYSSWAQARDSFRQLHLDEDLTAEQRQLAAILQEYDQNRINWYQRQSELLIRHTEIQEQLQQAEQDRLLLEQKIQALTDLEAVISTRKEQ